MRWSIALLIVVLPVAVHAQLVAPELKTITMRDGLSDDHVWSLAKDQRGQLWIGTKNGLNRYDGRRVTVFRAEGRPNSLPGDYITALAVDTGRTLYIGTNAPYLTLFDVLADTLLNIPLPDPEYSRHGEQRITSLRMDKQHRLWIGHGARALSLFDPATRTFRTTEIPPPLPTSRTREVISFIDEGNDGVLWLSLFRGLVRFDPATRTSEPISLHPAPGEPDLAKTFHIRGLVDEDSTLIFGTWSEGIFRMRKRDGGLHLLWPARDHVPTMVDHMVTNMCRLPNGLIMVATIDQGLLQLDPRSGQVLHFDRSLREKDCRKGEDLFAGCYRLLALPEALVMGSTMQGVAIWPLRNMAVQPIQLPEHPEEETIDMVVGTSHNHLRPTIEVLSQRRGLFTHDAKGKLVGHARVAYHPDQLLATVCAEPDGAVLIGGTPHTLDALPGAAELTLSTRPPAGTVCATGALWIREDNKDGYWIMVPEHGLHHWRKADDVCVPIGIEHPAVATLLSEWPWDVFVDRDGRSWFMSANTPPVVLHPDGRAERVVGPPSLAPFEVNDMAQTPDGQLWFAVKHRGLAVLRSRRKGTNEVEDVSDQLASRNILEVQAMKDGSLWMSQPNTIMHWDPRTGTSRVLSVLDGIAPAPLNLDPDHEPADYPLLVGTWEGFYMVHESALGGAIPPRVHMPSVLLGDSVLLRNADRARSALTLPTGPDRITFLLRTDNLIDPQRDELAYRMVGQDTAWSVIGDEERITFNHLAPGAYRFEVKARTNGGAWGAITAVPFAIPPPFWATWWFRALLVGGAVAIIHALFRIVLRRRMKMEHERMERERALMAERMRIAHDLHDDLGSSLALIAMEGELARMGDGSGAHDALKRVSEGAREVTDNMRRIVWALGSGQDTLGDLAAYIRSSAAELMERADVELSTEIGIADPRTKLTTDQRRHLLLITKELLLNVVKHAQAQRATMHIIQQNGSLRLVIVDNGKGFDAAERIGTGTGTTSLFDRVKALGGTVDLQSAVGAGTHVTIEVPLTMEEV